MSGLKERVNHLSFVSTVDPLKEPPLIMANTVLSILDVDYPVDKVSCYVSDDGAATLTLESLVETTNFSRNDYEEYKVRINALVFLGHTGAHDIEGNELPRLVYVSREKRPCYQHHKKAGAENALVRVSGVLTNAPFIINLDCDHYVNNSKAVREAMCFLMDPKVRRDVYYVQFS
ncbi:hypothetical protein AHAS_Ahas07G0090800 [Arachis hypogaea]